MTRRVRVYRCDYVEDGRACGLVFEDDAKALESIGHDHSHDECHHPWDLLVAQEMATAWNTRETLLLALSEASARTVAPSDRPALITAIAVLETAAANDRAQLAHYIAEGADKVVQDVYRRGAARRDEAANLLIRLASALPPVPGVKP